MGQGIVNPQKIVQEPGLRRVDTQAMIRVRGSLLPKTTVWPKDARWTIGDKVKTKVDRSPKDA